MEERWSRTVTETYRDSKGHTRTRTRRESGWTNVAGSEEMIYFYLQDDSGVILVHPDGAKIEPREIMSLTCGPSDSIYYDKGPPGAISNSDYRRRFTEKALPLHTPLYIMGQARERKDIVAPEIAADPKADIFIISTRTEEQVGSGLMWTGVGLGLLGLVLAAGSFAARSYMLGHLPEYDFIIWIWAATGYILAWILGWALMVFNSLVQLRQRVKQAWANVDVLLKLRADLIPNLINITIGLRDYEKNLHTELVQLRAQMAATRPGLPGPDPQACAGQLLAIAEQYPELKANEAFMNLQKNLTETENRISLAREYFNDIATFYNIRIDIVPDKLIAALGAMKSQPLMAGDNFRFSDSQLQ